MQRRGEFIWTPRQPLADLPFRRLVGDGPRRRDDGRNRWVMFRKRCRIDEIPEHVTIDITADGAYLLFVNGRRVGRGPARGAPSHKLYDSHVITPLLSQGENIIAVLVHSYGIETAWYETSKDYWQAIFGDGGLYCIGYSDPAEKPVIFATDSSWRCADSEAWNRDTPLSGWGQDFIEDYDARKSAASWTSAAFDDSAWSRAHVLVDERSHEDHVKGFGPIRPFPVLQPSNLPRPEERLVLPSGIVSIFGLKPDSALAIDKRIYTEQILTPTEGAVEAAESLLTDDEKWTKVRTEDGCDIAILVEFDALYSGYPFIELEGDGGEIVEVAVAEQYDGEFGDDRSVKPRIVRSSFLDGAHLFRYTTRDGKQRFEKFEWTAVRYLQLVVRNAPNGINIRSVGVRSTHYPAKLLGSFRSSDSLLDALWSTASYTVLQCSHDAWEDCPGREKRQWVGDGVSRYPVAAAAFGNSMQPLDRLFLQHTAYAQRNDGLIQMYAPGDHKTTGIVIPDYSLHYILIVHDYLMHTGDTETVSQVWTAVPKSLDWFQNFVDERGLLTDIPHWHFIEWADVGRQGTSACINLLHIAAQQAAASVARHLGFERYAARYEAQSCAQVEALNKYFWDDERGVYVDCIDPQNGERASRVSQQANALALLFDVADVKRRDQIIEYITDSRRTKLTAAPPVVPVGEDFDPKQDVVRCNSFFSHFLYSALGHCGRTDLALQLIREHYAPMLATGTSTLWESFDPSASLCHAFSATPLYQLSAYVLGVRPTEAGFKRFAVSPQICDLTSVQGTYPTPNGSIDVQWKVEKATVHLQIRVPKGIAGSFVPPAGFELIGESIELTPGTHKLSIRRGAERG